jgi:hypothetical protein
MTVGAQRACFLSKPFSFNENRLVVFGGKSGRYQSDRRAHWSIDPLHECRRNTGSAAT